MESEAPISKSLLCKKILSEWGISRLGTRVEAQIETALDTLNIYRTEYEGLVFCWNDKEQCASYSIYRPVSDREATDIPPEEIANAIRQLLTDSIRDRLNDSNRNQFYSDRSDSTCTDGTDNQQ